MAEEESEDNIVPSFSAKKVRWTSQTISPKTDLPPEKDGGQKTQILKSAASWKQPMTYSTSGMINNSAFMENAFAQELSGTSEEEKQKEEAEVPMQKDGSDLDDDEEKAEAGKEKEGEDDLEKVKVASENEEPS